MIEIKHLSKTFQMKDGAVNALKDISLTIPDGSIYGIIGMSGAGKSTLVRCINLLERPTEGSVVIDGVEMEKLTPAQLRQRRACRSRLHPGHALRHVVLTEHRRRAAGNGRRDIFVSVRGIAGDRDEEVARPRRAGVVAHAGDFKRSVCILRGNLHAGQQFL